MRSSGAHSDRELAVEVQQCRAHRDQELARRRGGEEEQEKAAEEGVESYLKI